MPLILVGLFIGPVVLAVGYTLLDAWVKEDEHPASDKAVAPPQEKALP